jgi:hypothetical protein
MSRSFGVNSLYRFCWCNCGRLALSKDLLHQSCTGYRTELIAADARRREVHQHRYTSLDRIIQRDADRAEAAQSPFFTVSKDPSRAGASHRKVGSPLMPLKPTPSSD